LFQPIRKPDGHTIEEDLSFCAWWRAIGGEIWLDGKGLMSHSARETRKTTRTPYEMLMQDRLKWQSERRGHGPSAGSPPRYRRSGAGRPRAVACRNSV
jgi:hypothetical protein